MSVQWQIFLSEGDLVTPIGSTHRVSLESEDQTVSVAGMIFIADEGGGRFERILQNDFLLAEEMVVRICRAICRRLWNSLFEKGVLSIGDDIDLAAFIQGEFGDEANSVMDLIDRSLRTFELICEDA